MPDARLQRTRTAYRDECVVSIVTAPPIFVEEAPPYNFGPPCWCNGLPGGVEFAQCPAHPMRTLRRGPVGTTN